MSPCLRCLLVGATFALTGCPRAETPPRAPTTPRPSVALRVLVVNEPGVAEALNRLHGEWAERSRGEVTATHRSWKEVAAANSIDADAIVFPSRYLGELCVRGWLRPVRPNVLESEEFNADDLFPLVRRELIKWGGEVMSLPLGLDVAIPGLPLPNHPGIRLLAQAAPALVAGEREGVLFAPASMKPQIDEPPFIAALSRLAESKDAKADTETDSAQAIAVFGFDDRLVAVTTASRNGASAFKLIAWLASAETSAQLATPGDRLLPVRRSLASSATWYGESLNTSQRSELANKLDAAMSGEKCILVPRIPAIDEYMTALDKAVESASSKKVDAIAALQHAAERWEQITDSHGHEKQRKAYWKHLGIGD